MQIQNFATFSSKPLKATLQKTIQHIKKYFVNDSWDLGDRKFQDLHAQEFFNTAIAVHGKSLWVDYNKKPSIIKDISRPNFLYLQTIYLGDNNITNIQNLAFIEAPQIKTIALNDNLISNLQSLSKCNFKNVQYISLNGNRAFQFESLRRMTLQKLEKLKLLDQICPFKVWQNINVLWMMKTEMGKETAQVFFDPKFITTAELCLIKLKLRRKNYAHPFSTGSGFDNSSSCSPIQGSQ